MTEPNKRKRCKHQSRNQAPSSPSQRNNRLLVGDMLDHSLSPTPRKRRASLDVDSNASSMRMIQNHSKDLHNNNITTHSETAATNDANLSSKKKESKNGNHPQSNQNKTKSSARIARVEKKDGGNDKMKKMIRKEEINLLPLVSWDGPVRLLNSLLEMKEAVQEIMSSGDTILGFDTETRPSFQKGEYHPPALVQIATSTCVYLFRISQTRSLDPLLPLLEASHIMKTGVAIQNDVKELLSMCMFRPQGFVEIASLTRDVLGYENIGLRALAAIFMNKRVSKGAQTSNWARPQLSHQQTRYAATDAWISREIYVRAKMEHEELLQSNETTTTK